MSTKADLLRARFSSAQVLSVTKGTPIKAYLLPSTDAHQSEYLADHDFRVKFLTGFTGSNAYVAVTNDKAVLWTDGRYFIQVNCLARQAEMVHYKGEYSFLSVPSVVSAFANTSVILRNFFRKSSSATFVWGGMDKPDLNANCALNS
ncbi:hypothetical protein COOONC_02268 [Cooperia oncophora]